MSDIIKHGRGPVVQQINDAAHFVKDAVEALMPGEIKVPENPAPKQFAFAAPPEGSTFVMAGEITAKPSEILGQYAIPGQCNCSSCLLTRRHVAIERWVKLEEEHTAREHAKTNALAAAHDGQRFHLTEPTVTINGRTFGAGWLLISETEYAELAADHAWRDQFDCCMCGSRMDAHDIGSGHAPVSEYDYVLGMAQDKVRAITEAVDAYHQALTDRKHGGVAADVLVKAVERVLNKHWSGT